MNQSQVPSIEAQCEIGLRPANKSGISEQESETHSETSFKINGLFLVKIKDLFLSIFNQNELISELFIPSYKVHDQLANNENFELYFRARNSNAFDIQIKPQEKLKESFSTSLFEIQNLINNFNFDSSEEIPDFKCEILNEDQHVVAHFDENFLYLVLEDENSESNILDQIDLFEPNTFVDCFTGLSKDSKSHSVFIYSNDQLWKSLNFRNEKISKKFILSFYKTASKNRQNHQPPQDAPKNSQKETNPQKETDPKKVKKPNTHRKSLNDLDQSAKGTKTTRKPLNIGMSKTTNIPRNLFSSSIGSPNSKAKTLVNFTRKRSFSPHSFHTHKFYTTISSESVKKMKEEDKRRAKLQKEKCELMTQIGEIRKDKKEIDQLNAEIDLLDKYLIRIDPQYKDGIKNHKYSGIIGPTISPSNAKEIFQQHAESTLNYCTVVADMCQNKFNELENEVNILKSINMALFEDNKRKFKDQAFRNINLEYRLPPEDEYYYTSDSSSSTSTSYSVGDFYTASSLDPKRNKQIPQQGKKPEQGEKNDHKNGEKDEMKESEREAKTDNKEEEERLKEEGNQENKHEEEGNENKEDSIEQYNESREEDSIEQNNENKEDSIEQYNESREEYSFEQNNESKEDSFEQKEKPSKESSNYSTINTFNVSTESNEINANASTASSGQNEASNFSTAITNGFIRAFKKMKIKSKSMSDLRLKNASEEEEENASRELKNSNNNNNSNEHIPSNFSKNSSNSNQLFDSDYQNLGSDYEQKNDQEFDDQILSLPRYSSEEKDKPAEEPQEKEPQEKEPEHKFNNESKLKYIVFKNKDNEQVRIRDGNTGSDDPSDLNLKPIGILKHSNPNFRSEVVFNLNTDEKEKSNSESSSQTDITKIKLPSLDVTSNPTSSSKFHKNRYAFNMTDEGYSSEYYRQIEERELLERLAHHHEEEVAEPKTKLRRKKRKPRINPLDNLIKIDNLDEFIKSDSDRLKGDISQLSRQRLIAMADRVARSKEVIDIISSKTTPKELEISTEIIHSQNRDLIRKIADKSEDIQDEEKHIQFFIASRPQTVSTAEAYISLQNRISEIQKDSKIISEKFTSNSTVGNSKELNEKPPQRKKRSSLSKNKEKKSLQIYDVAETQKARQAFMALEKARAGLNEALNNAKYVLNDLEKTDELTKQISTSFLEKASEESAFLVRIQIENERLQSELKVLEEEALRISRRFGGVPNGRGTRRSLLSLKRTTQNLISRNKQTAMAALKSFALQKYSDANNTEQKISGSDKE